MAHDVVFELPRRKLGYMDLIFEVHTDGELLGKLKVSKGAVVWTPAWGKRSYRMDWGRLDRVMQEQGTKGRW